ncbi:MAG TPA: hypothetical protein VNZ53_27815 [Steroidobacteraceae bacterium]|jgi:hypothetical protein|nr:hypothetical protein [Steroidobacteraceae bacterium]
MTLAKIAAALRAAAAVLEADEAATETAPAAKKTRAKATESAPPAATPAPAAATAPAAAPAATQPEAPTVVQWKDVNPASKTHGQVLKGIAAVNGAVLFVAGKDRDKALAVLAEFKVSRTPELKAEQYQAVIDRMEEELAKIDAASTQASLV